MIKVYTSKASDKRARQIVSWLESYNLDFQVMPKKNITQKVIQNMLELSELGFEEILVPYKKLSVGNANIVKHLKVEKMSTSALIKVIAEHPELLRDPITFDENKLLIGYNGEDIRQFIPRHYRGY